MKTKSLIVRENLDRATIQKRLLLLYGLGMNIGLKRVSAGDHGESQGKEPGARDESPCDIGKVMPQHLTIAGM